MEKKIYQGEFKSIRNVNHSLNVTHSNNMNILIQKSQISNIICVSHLLST
jgi:hypothetical protein